VKNSPALHLASARDDLAARRSDCFSAVSRRIVFSLLFLDSSLSLLGQDTNDPAGLPSPGDQLQQMVVTGEEPVTTEVRALQDQRLAPNVENVRSAEEIGKYPDVNIADALKRMPGAGVQNDTGEGRYITIRGLDSNLVGVTFGGVRVPSTDSTGRHVAFDQIPAGLVSQIIITKANTADMDAEALGGTIELTPRSAFDLNQPSLQGHVGSGWEPLRHQYGIVDAEVVGGLTFGFGPGGNPFAPAPASAVTPTPDGKSVDTKDAGSGEGPITPYRPFGVLGEFSFYEDHRGVDDFEPAYSDSIPPIGADKILRAIDFRRYTDNRTLHGVGGTFDFRPDSNNSFYISFVNAGYSEQVRRQIFNLSGLDGSNLGPDGVTPGTLSANPNGSFTATNVVLTEALRFNIEHFENWIVQGGGRNVIGPFIIDYKGSFAQAWDDNPHDFNPSFSSTPSETVVYNNSGLSNKPSFQFSDPLNPALNGNRFDPTQYVFSGLTIDNNHTLDTEIAGSMNLTWLLDVQGNPSNLKFGTSLRFRSKTFSDNPATYSTFVDPATGTNNFTLARAMAGHLNTLYNGFYQIGFSPDPGRFNTFTSTHPGFIRNVAADQLRAVQAFYDDTENVFAGYGQYDITLFGRLNLLAGLRAEVTNAVYGANANSPGSDPNLASSYHFVNRPVNYTDFFPTAQARFEIISNILQTRLAYSTAIGRPAFSQVTAATVVDTGNLTITTGNPNLKPTTANNFDFTLEYTPTQDSYFSVDLFDKEFDNYIFTRTIRTVIGGQIFNESTFLNSGTAYARGIELAFEEHMRFLPGPLSGLGFTANYTYVDSEGRARTTDHTKLPFTSPNVYNLAVFYEKYGFLISLAGQYTDHNLSSVGTTSRLDQYFDSRFTLDLAVSYMTRYGVGVYFNAKNLTNAPWRIYEGSANRPIQREFYDITYEAGMKFKF
jgi:TonB-dependent receptor